jgi:hypothetical protein
MNYSFLRQVFIVIDQVFNVLTGGWADETMSARAYRTFAKGRIFGRIFMPPIDALFSWQKPDPEVNMLAGKTITRHCERAFWKEILRRDNAPEYR